MKSNFWKIIAVYCVALICAAAALLASNAVFVLSGNANGIGSRGIPAGITIATFILARRILHKIICEGRSFGKIIFWPIVKKMFYPESTIETVIKETKEDNINDR